jgi:hypothetical protein
MCHWKVFFFFTCVVVRYYLSCFSRHPLNGSMLLYQIFAIRDSLKVDFLKLFSGVAFFYSRIIVFFLMSKLSIHSVISICCKIMRYHKSNKLKMSYSIRYDFNTVLPCISRFVALCAFV